MPTTGTVLLFDIIWLKNDPAFPTFALWIFSIAFIGLFGLVYLVWFT
jgi:hypothetical protein